MAREEYEITWEADDGYVGGSRPHYISVSLDEFDSGQTLEEITKQLEETIQNDFEQRVHWFSRDYTEVAQQIFDALQAQKDEE